jgi:PAS domain S-box-containing protein
MKLLSGLLFLLLSRKNMSKTVHAENDLLLFAFENLIEAVFLADSDGKIFYVNAAACHYLKYEKNELERMNLSEIDVSFYDEGWALKWSRLKEKRNSTIKTIHRAKDGLLLPVEIQAHYFCYHGQEFGLSFVHAMPEDQEIPQKNVGIFDHNLIHAHTEPLFLLNNENRILDVNSAFAKITQFSQEELIGKEFQFCFLLPNLAEQVCQVIFDKGTLSEFPLDLKTKGGISVPVLVNALVLHDLQGQVNNVIVSVHDLSHEKEAEHSLRINDERFRRAQALGHVGNWEYDIRNNQFWGSEEAKRIYGFDPVSERFSVQEVENCIPNRIEVHQALIDLIEQEKPYVLEFEILPKNGQPAKIIHSIAELKKDEKGNPIAVEGVIQDVTEQKKLQEKTNLLASIVASSDEAIIGKTLEGVVTSWNKGAELIYGYSSEEIIGKSITVVVPEEDRESVLQILSDIRAGKSIHHYEAKRCRKDGKIIDVSLAVSPILDATGKITGISTIAHDITREKTSAAINASRLHLIEYSLAHSLSELLEETINEIEKLTKSQLGFFHFIEEDQGKVALENWSTNTQTQCGAKGIGMHYPIEQAGVWANCFYSQQAEIHNDFKSLPDRKGFPEFHADVIREVVVPVIRGEKVIAILGVGNKLSDYDQEDVATITRIADLAWDIAERKRAEEQLHRLNQELEARVYARTKELENANSELESFAYSVSHDLRAPLRHINGYIQLLREHTSQKMDADSLHYMDIITQSANLMDDLIDGILSFSRMGRIEMNFQEVNMHDLVEAVITEFQPDIQTRQVKWIVQELPNVIGDPALLRIVIANLVSNALKFSQKREVTRIEIGSEPAQEGQVVFWVRDNGVGFDMKFVDRLFKVFQRLHRADEIEGTGIGLANVNRVITRHGGKTWAVGKVGEGATFYFSLPARKMEE